MWSVHEPEPNDDWLYDMKGNMRRQCQFLVTNNLVRPPVCPDCESETRPIASNVNLVRNRTRNEKPFKWKCTDPACNATCSFLSNSYLRGHRISLFKHIQLLYKFYMKRDAHQCHEETGIGYGTCKAWFDYYRRCINKYMQDQYYPQFVFDVDLAIEWDEAALSARQKHHRGRYRQPVWVLGGVQADSNVCMLKVVERRDAQTLQSIIRSVTVAGSTIVTDGWRAYQGLSNHGLFHWSVDHSRHFVNPYHRKHTNRIEGLWALIRGDLRASRGIKPCDLQKHLDVWTFRRNMKVSADNGVWISLCLVVGAVQSSVPKPHSQ